MHLQENTSFDTKCCPVPSTSCDQYSGTKFEVAMFKGLGGDAFTRKFSLTLGSTHNNAQYPLHYVSYSGTKF